MEEMLEYLSDDREGYIEYRHMHKEYCDNLLAA